MGIFERISSIVKANVNDALDKAEDPSKMVDQTLRELRENLAEVKKETALVMAEEDRCKTDLEEAKSKVAKFEEAAKRYLKGGDETKARQCLERKAETEASLATLEANYKSIQSRATTARQAHDNLVAKIKEWEGKAAGIKSTVAVAKSQEHVNKALGAANSSKSLGAMSRMEEKAERMLREADAQATLNQSMEDESDESLLAGSGVTTGAVDDDLERLKREMGM